MAPPPHRKPGSASAGLGPWVLVELLVVRRLLAVFGLFAALASPAIAQDRHYAGVAYAEDGRTVRYREEHWLFRDAGVPTRLVLYRCPSGEPFARKLMRERDDAAAPDFDFVDARDGYREGVHRDGNRWRIYVRKGEGAPLDTGVLAARPDMVVDAGFDAFVREHWADFAGAAHLGIAFVVPSRLDYLDLQLGSARDTRLGDVAVRQLRLSLGGLLGALAPTIELTYAVDSRRLLRFEGISNIRDNRGRSQRVRIDFPPSLESPAPDRADIEAAEAVPLARRCAP